MVVVAGGRVVVDGKMVGRVIVVDGGGRWCG